MFWVPFKQNREAGANGVEIILCVRSQLLRGTRIREYQCENEKFSLTVFACSYGAPAVVFYNKWVENNMTLSLYGLKVSISYELSLNRRPEKLYQHSN